MAVNPFFLNGTIGEQGLVQDLTNELIRMAGHDVIYLPRKFIKDEKIIREISTSKFDIGFTIEAYVSTFDGFGGQGDILSKFGVRTTDEMTFIISKERFNMMITPILEKKDDIKVAKRPQEGDLIYFPVDNSLFEVKYIEFKRPFYQLNKLYVYELRCELFEYEDEIIDTGIENVDETVRNFGYNQTLKMVPSTAAVGILTTYPISQSLKSVYYIDVINGGYGFKSPPIIEIEKAPVGGVDAKAIATLKIKGNESTVDRVLIINPGLGYSNPPNVSFTSSTGKGFIATSRISTGVLSPMLIVNPGFGYTSSPTISISTSLLGENAEAIPVISSGSTISQVRYVNAGYGYTQSPVTTISNPVGISTGSYEFNEIITGDQSGTTAYVKNWNVNNRLLEVSIMNGEFVIGETIVGAGASYTLFSIDTYDSNEPFAGNREIETEALEILDFDESNPFGNF